MRDAVYIAAALVLGGVIITVPAAFPVSGIIAGFKGLSVRAGSSQVKSNIKLMIQLSEEIRVSGIEEIRIPSGGFPYNQPDWRKGKRHRARRLE